MATLTSIEKRHLEKVFDMGGGYVLDFSNRTFAEFFAECADIDIYDEKYDYSSGSKANRLRAFWDIEGDHVVGKVLADLLEIYKDLTQTNEIFENKWNEGLYLKCSEIASRLKSNLQVQDSDAFDKETGDPDFDKLARIVKEYIERDDPSTGLDRLHTFLVKYVRRLCEKHGIKFDKEKALHSAFGEYVKQLKATGKLESEMTERILKSSISLMDSFNDIRNNRSYAHDNPLLQYNESLLIFRSVSSTVKFIDFVEEPSSKKKSKGSEPESEFDDDLPF